MHGWLILDKPSGITSAHAVAKVKRLLKPGKIGHAGTLDPLASGVLPLALGEATKTVGYMMDASKAYLFTVLWGSETDSDDSQGKVTLTSPNRAALSQIEAILPEFIGQIDQAPPSYSAIKIDGKRAYALAREGHAPEMKARKVRVDSLEMTEQNAESTSFICHCGKGTYVRSLARDMGRRLGCYGHIVALRRIKVGKFTENHAISLEKLEEMVHKGDLGFFQPVTSALDDIPAVTLTANQATWLKQGQSVENSGMNGTVKLLCDGKLIAIGDAAGGRITPRRVFNLSG